MRTIREAIENGARSIYLNDGTLIVHLDHGQTYDAVCPPKNINGKKVYRWIFCRITNTQKRLNRVFLQSKDKYKDPLHLDYILSERNLNEFINDCGGIDDYHTMYWARDWMFY